MLREDAPGVEKEIKESRADSRQEVKLRLRRGRVVLTLLYSTANDP